MGTIGSDHNLIFTAAGGPGPSPIPEPGTLAAMAILPVARPRRDGADAKREGSPLTFCLLFRGLTKKLRARGSHGERLCFAHEQKFP